MLNRDQLIERGGRAQIQEIATQLSELLQELPALRPFAHDALDGLFNGKAKAAKPAATALDGAPAETVRAIRGLVEQVNEKQKKRFTMSAAHRKSVSKHMKAYWAKRRAAEAKAAK